MIVLVAVTTMMTVMTVVMMMVLTVTRVVMVMTVMTVTTVMTVMMVTVVMMAMVVIACLYRSQGGPDNATGTRSASASPVALMATRILCAYQGSATSRVKGA